MTRNEAREKIMQILYELDASKALKEPEALESAFALAQERLTGNHVGRAKDMLGSIIDNLESIDATINSCSTGWKTGRMPKVDLAIMRQAVCEIMYCDDVPAPVAVNEAINLAKKFSTDKSAGFIHGVLGAVSKL